MTVSEIKLSDVLVVALNRLLLFLHPFHCWNLLPEDEDDLSSSPVKDALQNMIRSIKAEKGSTQNDRS